MLNEVSFVLLLISWYLLSPIDACAVYRWSWPKIPTPASFSDIGRAWLLNCATADEHLHPLIAPTTGLGDTPKDIGKPMSFSRSLGP